MFDFLMKDNILIYVQARPLGATEYSSQLGMGLYQ